jgi:hypothetical protein
VDNYTDSLVKEYHDCKVNRKCFCLLAGINYSTLSSWLNGFCKLSKEKQDRILSAIDVIKGKISKEDHIKRFNMINRIEL